MAELDVAGDRAAWRALVDHDERIEAIERALAKRSRRKWLLAYVRPARWSLLASLLTNMALLFWLSISNESVAAAVGGILFWIDFWIAVIVSAQAIDEALSRQEAGK